MPKKNAPTACNADTPSLPVQNAVASATSGADSPVTEGPCVADGCEPDAKQSARRGCMCTPALLGLVGLAALAPRDLLPPLWQPWIGLAGWGPPRLAGTAAVRVLGCRVGDVATGRAAGFLDRRGFPARSLGRTQEYAATREPPTCAIQALSVPLPLPFPKWHVLVDNFF